MSILKEEQFGKGALPDLHDGRDFSFGAYLESYEDKVGEITLDWDNDYQGKNNLYYKFPVKNQFISLSCVGQSCAGFKEVVEYYLKRSETKKSAKSVYSQIALPQGGAYFRDGMRIITNYGINTEDEVPSHNNGVVDESFMKSQAWMNDYLTKQASRYANQNFYSLKGFDIDTFAKAIKIGKGCVMGVIGTNNGTWMSKFPQPPTTTTPQGQLWGHAIIAVDYLKIDGKKYIKIKNSWGNIGEDGYQYLGEEWFENQGLFIYSPWVIASKLMFTQNDLKHAHAYSIFIKTSSGRKQRQGFCIFKDGENKLIIASEAIVTKLREDIAQKEYTDAKNQPFWAFSTPKLTIEINADDYNALKKYDQSWKELEDNL
jgi:hypothetical protein